ncbi:uncharacterized protein LOC128226116 [Mya arenaria]|uniref:uncharacterized protein LOC128226116 n=1 Tax=Mya arenaria TaxID=6604 RepID=UPI0022E61BEF|nr:uncharacterized protein LOC128226116 [Mya arenaria]
MNKTKHFSGVGFTLLFLVFPVCVFSLCVFRETSEVLFNICEWSSWENWNCTSCCRNAPIVRHRGICCDEHDTTEDCLSKCNATEHDGKNFANCSTVCPIEAKQACQTTQLSIPTTPPSISTAQPSIPTTLPSNPATQPSILTTLSSNIATQPFTHKRTPLNENNNYADALFSNWTCYHPEDRNECSFSRWTLWSHPVTGMSVCTLLQLLVVLLVLLALYSISITVYFVYVKKKKDVFPSCRWPTFGKKVRTTK